MPTSIPSLLFWILCGAITVISSLSLLVLSMFRSDVKAIWVEIKDILRQREEDQRNCHEFVSKMMELKGAHDTMMKEHAHNRKEGDR